MKAIDVIVAVLLIIGGLNWGLVGLIDYDVVAAIFGHMSSMSRIIYFLVGIAALYDLVMLRAITRRWDMHFHKTAHA